jgi:adenosinetriphosphatase
MHLFDTNYDVYSHSYLCYGHEQSRLVFLSHIVKETNETLSIDDPCLQSGYIQNMTYDELFSTACTPEQHALPVGFNKSEIFSFV